MLLPTAWKHYGGLSLSLVPMLGSNFSSENRRCVTKKRLFYVAIPATVQAGEHWPVDRCAEVLNASNLWPLCNQSIIEIVLSLLKLKMVPLQ